MDNWSDDVDDGYGPAIPMAAIEKWIDLCADVVSAAELEVARNIDREAEAA